MKRLTEKRKNEILGIIFLVLGLINILHLFWGDTGRFGESMFELIHLFLGQGVFLFPLLLFYLGYQLIKNKKIQLGLPQLGITLVFLVFLAFFHAGLPSGEEIYEGMRSRGGGLFGGSLIWLVRQFFSDPFSYLVLVVLGLIGLLFWSGMELADLWRKIVGLFSFRKKDKTPRRKKRAAPKKRVIEESWQDQKEEEPEEQAPVITPKPGTGYRLPPLHLLRNHNGTAHKKPEDQTQLLEKTLSDFGIDAQVIKVTHGPRISRYELQPAPGVKVSRIVNLADDIALALAAPDVRIEAPIPGKAALGIEVPHNAQQVVGLREILASSAYADNPALLSIVLGKDIAGQPIVKDLGKMPHLLIAGATGTGKSVALNTLILSLLYRATPEEARLVLIDPKQVELTNFKALPHLLVPVVNQVNKAAGVLQQMVQEMQNRYELFSELGVRGISEYNEIQEMEDQEKVLPLIVIIIDELADLMMAAPKDVEDSICRLAQMARAAGIHLIIATQRPSVDIITGLIKVNIPTRISFYVSSQTDSRTILDMGGAEKLMGDGDMLYSPVGAIKPVRIQGPFVSTAEVKKVVKHIKDQQDPNYEMELGDIGTAETSLTNEKRDSLYPEAVQLVVESRQASISILQRRMNIGYTRAARMIDTMEQDGIIGAFAGSKPRKVLLDKEDLPEFLEEIQSR